MDKDKYFQHNYHNDKVIKWVIENDKGSGNLASEIRGSKNLGFGCDCEYENDSFDFYETIIDVEDEIIDAIPDLTEDEKEELIEEIVQLYIYECFECGYWCLDGFNC